MSSVVNHALFINGIFRTVLDQILETQANNPNHPLFLRPPSITTTDRKKGILSTLHSNLPTRSTALWPCLPRSDFRSKTDQIEEASL